jgi:hypothetical protein
MITGYQTPRMLEPHVAGRIQWSKALFAGLIAGAVLLVVPRGSPWSNLTFFSPVVMGRDVLEIAQSSLLGIWALHLVIAVMYGLIISALVAGLTQFRAVLTGGAIGLGLYAINFAIVNWFLSAYRGNELSVAFTHVVFGLIAAGAYRGLLRRRHA